MKRFYRTVAVKQVGGTFGIVLDGRPVKTPNGETLALHTAKLAEAVAAEWAEQGDKIDQRTMPLTALANTAQDHVAGDRAATLGQVETFARHDLVCYRAADPPELAVREVHAWDAPLAWARTRYGLDLKVTHGVGSIDQPSVSRDSIERALARFDAFALTGLVTAAGIMKSLVLALSLADGRLDAAAAHAAAHVDEFFQAEKWGRDSEAEARLKSLLKELEDAEHFMQLSLPSP
ncbi:MAG: ATP12 family protein [Rhizomicrobium sp.]